MQTYHPLTVFSGCVVVASWILFFCFWIAAIRMMRAHRRVEKAAQASGRKITRVICGASLPTLLRVMLIGCTTAGVVLLPFAAVMIFMKVPTVDRRGSLYISPFSDGSNDFTSETRLCIACAKLVTSGYVQAKAWTYSFLFIKGRIAQPNQKMKWHEWIVLAATLAMPVFAAVVGWLTRASRNMLDDTCEWALPVWLIIVMAIADSILSVLYLASFIRPLRQIIAANRMRRRRLPVPNSKPAAVAQAPSQTGSVVIRVSSPSAATTASTASVGSTSPRDRVRQLDVASPVSFTAVSFAPQAQTLGLNSVMHHHPIVHPTRDPDHGDALEVVLRKNLLSCVVCVLSTLVALVMMLVAHLNSDPYLERLTTPFGIFDLCIVLVSLFLLMHSSSAAAAAVSHSSPDPSRMTNVKTIKLHTAGLHSSRQHQPHPSLLGSPSQAHAAVERSTAAANLVASTDLLTTGQPPLSTSPPPRAPSPAIPSPVTAARTLASADVTSPVPQLPHGARRSSRSVVLISPALASHRLKPTDSLTISGRGKGLIDVHGPSS